MTGERILCTTIDNTQVLIGIDEIRGVRPEGINTKVILKDGTDWIIEGEHYIELDSVGHFHLTERTKKK